jgi:hypothetical protein
MVAGDRVRKSSGGRSGLAASRGFRGAPVKEALLDFDASAMAPTCGGTSAGRRHFDLGSRARPQDELAASAKSVLASIGIR